MPTGSLCAERNVIGTALADNLTLTRKDFRYLAVYSFPSLGFNPGSRKPSSLFPDDGTGGNSLQAFPPSSTTMAIAGSSTRSLVSSPSMRKTVLDRTESWTELDYPDAERKSLSSPRNQASTLNRGEEEERKLSVGRSNFRTIRPNQLDTTMNFPSIWSSSEAQLSLLHEPKTSTTKFDTPLPPPGIPPRPSFATWRQLRLSPRKTHPVLAPQSNYSQKTTFVKTVTVEEW